MDTNTQNKPTPHPHAELIKAWADGAKIQMLINGEWHDRRSDKMEWLDDEQYRIKPEPWKPEDKGEFYYLSGSLHTHRCAWCNMTYDNELFNAGNCFRTREEAEAAAELVKIALKGEVVPVKELEALKTRNENLHKAKEALINKQTELDGKPLSEDEKEMIRLHREHVENAKGWRKQWEFLTDGEAALIRALRDATIRKVFPKDKTVLCFVDTDMNGKHSICDTDLHIAFETTIFDGNDKDEAIIAALKQIKTEQEASND